MPCMFEDIILLPSDCSPVILTSYFAHKILHLLARMNVFVSVLLPLCAFNVNGGFKIYCMCMLSI